MPTWLLDIKKRDLGREVTPWRPNFFFCFSTTITLNFTFKFEGQTIIKTTVCKWCETFMFLMKLGMSKITKMEINPLKKNLCLAVYEWFDAPIGSYSEGALIITLPIIRRRIIIKSPKTKRFYSIGPLRRCCRGHLRGQSTSASRWSRWILKGDVTLMHVLSQL